MITRWAANLIRAAMIMEGISNVTELSKLTGIPADSLRKKLTGKQRFYPVELQTVFKAIRLDDMTVVEIMKEGFEA